MNNINVGDMVRFTITDIANRKFDCEGIVNGRVKDHGGFKYIIKTWNVVEAPEIGIRKVRKTNAKANG